MIFKTYNINYLGSLRVIADPDKNELWFVGVDVAKLLNVSNVTKCIYKFVPQRDIKGFRLMDGKAGRALCKAISLDALTTLLKKYTKDRIEAEIFYFYLRDFILPDNETTSNIQTHETELGNITCKLDKFVVTYKTSDIAGCMKLSVDIINMVLAEIKDVELKEIDPNEFIDLQTIMLICEFLGYEDKYKIVNTLLSLNYEVYENCDSDSANQISCDENQANETLIKVIRESAYLGENDIIKFSDTPMTVFSYVQFLNMVGFTVTERTFLKYLKKQGYINTRNMKHCTVLHHGKFSDRLLNIETTTVNLNDKKIYVKELMVTTEGQKCFYDMIQQDPDAFKPKSVLEMENTIKNNNFMYE